MTVKQWQMTVLMQSFSWKYPVIFMKIPWKHEFSEQFWKTKRYVTILWKDDMAWAMNIKTANIRQSFICGTQSEKLTNLNKLNSYTMYWHKYKRERQPNWTVVPAVGDSHSKKTNTQVERIDYQMATACLRKTTWQDFYSKFGKFVGKKLPSLIKAWWTNHIKCCKISMKDTIKGNIHVAIN